YYCAIWGIYVSWFA
nr:immunoglobulin heavy chain junction region [Mus musculus]